MLKNIYVNYNVNGIPNDVYSALLGNADGSYGVKDHLTGAVLVASDTSVWQSGSGINSHHPIVGIYEYTLTLSPDTIYDVSWKLIVTNGANPIYVSQQIGPFDDSSPATFKAIPEFQGEFAVGHTGTLALRVIDMDGTPLTPEVISVRVVNHGDGSTVVTDTPEHLVNGLYVYEWPAGSSGLFDVYWSFTINGQSNVVVTQVAVAAQGTGTASSADRYFSLRLALEALIPSIQAIPIYHEQAKVSSDSQTYHFTFPRWNQSARANIYRNDVLVTAGFSVDFLKGMVVFDSDNLPEDVIYADYNFRYFDDYQLGLFLTNGVNQWNIYAPHTSWGVNSVPDQAAPAVLYAAANDAIRVFQNAILWPQQRVLFEQNELANAQFGNLDTLAKSYSDRFDKMAEQKKFFSYVGLTRLVFQPMFSLPGSRQRMFRYMFGGGGT